MRHRWTAWEMLFATVAYVGLLWLISWGMGHVAEWLHVKNRTSFWALLLTPPAVVVFAMALAGITKLVKIALRPILPASWYESLTRQRGRSD